MGETEKEVVIGWISVNRQIYIPWGVTKAGRGNPKEKGARGGGARVYRGVRIGRKIQTSSSGGLGKKRRELAVRCWWEIASCSGPSETPAQRQEGSTKRV